MERQTKEPDQDNGDYRKSRSTPSSPIPKENRKTPVEFIKLSPGMRQSDGPPPRSDKQPGSRTASKSKQSRKSPLLKNSGTNNPFASFMPLSTREREAKLALSEDEISSTIDTFSPLDQPDVPGTISGSISSVIPQTVSRSKRRDATTKVKAPVRAIHEINAEQLIPLDSSAPPVKPLTPSQVTLTRNLIIIAGVMLIFGVGGTAYMMLTMDAPISPTERLTKNDRKPDALAKTASILLSDKNATRKSDLKKAAEPETKITVEAASPKVVVETTLSQAAAENSQSSSTLKSTKTAAGEGASPAPVNTVPKRHDHGDAPSDENDVKKTAQKEETTSTVQTAPAASPEMVIIKLTGLPRDAAITVDGRVMDSPFEVPVSQKALKVVVNAPDYETAVKRIIPGRDKAVLVRMKRK